jgi:hypothetical protein
VDQNSTITAVVELSQSSWLVGGVVPGIERQPCKKLEPSPERLLAVPHRWRDEAVKAGRKITRIALAFEAGRDGFWQARLGSSADRHRQTTELLATVHTPEGIPLPPITVAELQRDMARLGFVFRQIREFEDTRRR